jgi:hypothetical protein
MLRLRLQKVRHTGELDLIMAHYVYGASKRTLARQQGVNEGYPHSPSGRGGLYRWLPVDAERAAGHGS